MAHARHERGCDRVLFADANPHIREIFEYVLRERGYQPVIASDGMQALELALAQPPLAAFLDLWLPEVCGLVVCRRLRAALRRDVLLVVMSADDDPALKHSALDGGADAFLVKPFEEERVFALLEKARAERIGRALAGSRSILSSQAAERGTGVHNGQHFCQFAAAADNGDSRRSGSKRTRRRARSMAHDLQSRDGAMGVTRDE